MFGIGIGEIALGALLALIFFGANRLPDIGRSLGDAMRDRKKAKREGEESEGEVEP